MSENARSKGGWLARMKQSYFCWFLLALAVGVGGTLSILTFAGIAVLPAPPDWWPVVVRVPILDSSAHGQVVAAAVSWFAGSIALFTFFLNRDQKERHLRQQLEEARQIEQARREQERQFENERERRERDLAELQRLEAEFAALADDFAQEASLARVNAAIGLGEIALKPDPRRLEDNGEVKPDPRGPIRWVSDEDPFEEPQYHERPWRDTWRSRKTERNYPYFLRAVHRLAAALHQWEEEAPRAQALRVLKEMGEWAKDEGTDEPLLHALVNALAEANRTAWALLREDAARSLAAGVESEQLLPLLGVEAETKSPWLGDSDAWTTAAREAFRTDLVQNLETTAAYLAFQASPVNERARSGELEARLRPVGQGFWATRDALATALRTLSAPPDMPEFPELLWRETNESEAWQLGVEDWWKAREEWRRGAAAAQARRSLDLRAVRLFGAQCSAHLEGAHCGEAHFEGADCSGAHLEGAHCGEAHFEGADCDEAHFEGADCRWAHFEGAVCGEAHFQGADCSGAHFEGAHCYGAHFEGAYCRRAHFEGAVCWEAHFEGAVCGEAHLEGAYCSGAHFEGAHCKFASLQGTRLAGAQMGQQGGEPTIFEGREWAGADFFHYELDNNLDWARSDKKDTELYDFLDRMYPQPTERTDSDYDPFAPDAEADEGEAGEQES